MTSQVAKRWTVRFAGRVQGVGFRYTTRSIARGYDVSGYVRNMPDGSVELVAEGASGELEAFLREIRDQFANYIRDERRDERAVTGEFAGFEIRY